MKIDKTAKRRWHTGYELNLVPGAHEADKVLAEKILKILREEFHLRGAYMTQTYPDDIEQDKFYPKSKKSFVIGEFPVKEARLDVGEITLGELNQREAIFYITHPYNLSLGVDAATTVMQIRLFGEILKIKNIGHKQLTLVTPIGPYDLNHSVRRNGKLGLVEGYALKIYLTDLVNAGYSEMIAIDSHSDTTKVEANNLGMGFRNIDPFRAEHHIMSPHLGPFLYKTPENNERRDDYNEKIGKLTPFVSFVREHFKDSIKDIYFVATDDGSEATISNLAYACRGDMQHILAIKKERDGHGRIRIKGVKSSSTCRLDEIAGKTCLLGDDRRLSGGTLNETAKELKTEYKAGYVAAMLSHDMSFDNKIQSHDSIDQFIFLETNPNSVIAKENYSNVTRLPIEQTAILLAAEIFDSYVTMREQGQIKIR